MKTHDFEQIQNLFVEGLDGDRAAYEAALSALAPYVRAYLRRRLIPAHLERDLEDIVQTVLISVHNKRATYERTLPLMPWVFGVAKYKLLQYLRSTSRRRAVFSDQALDTVSEPTLYTDPSVRPDVARMMNTLNPEQYDAIRLTKLEGLSMQDAADQSGVSLSAMKLRVHRAMRRLKKLSEDT